MSLFFYGLSRGEILKVHPMSYGVPSAEYSNDDHDGSSVKRGEGRFRTLLEAALRLIQPKKPILGFSKDQRPGGANARKSNLILAFAEYLNGDDGGSGRSVACRASAANIVQLPDSVRTVVPTAADQVLK